MSVCTCTEWPRLSPQCICDPRSATVQYLHSARRAFLSQRNADVWLRAYNARLGGVPFDLILAGYGATVVDEARRAAA